MIATLYLDDDCNALSSTRLFYLSCSRSSFLFLSVLTLLRLPVSTDLSGDRALLIFRVGQNHYINVYIWHFWKNIVIYGAYRVGQNHIQTVYIRYFWQGSVHIYIWYYTVKLWIWPTLLKYCSCPLWLGRVTQPSPTPS